MAKSFTITLQGGDPRVKPGGEAIFSYFAIGFPVNVGSNGLTYAGDFESFDGDPGSIGQIVINIENNFANYITQSQGFTMDNNVALNEVEIFDTPVPCSLDYDANGYVSTGDIDATFTNFYGASTQDLIDAGLGELSATLDINQDGVVDDLDYPSILEYVGSEGCNTTTPVQLSQYPRYLDNHPDSVAFAYSLRKLRSSYEGPCMSVRLDIDARCFSDGDTTRFWKSLCDLGPEITDTPDTLPDDYYVRIGDYYQNGVLTAKPFVGDQSSHTNVRDAWNYFKNVYKINFGLDLDQPLDIPFGPDGYIDYSKIQQLMDNPLEAYGINLPAGFDSIFDFEYSSISRHIDPSLNVSFKDKCVVLIDRWYDQRADEQRDMVGEVTKANEWGFHPFSITSLMVGRFGKVMQKDGGMVIGSGTMTGLGDRAHNEYGVTEMCASENDLIHGNVATHGCAIVDPSVQDVTNNSELYSSPGVQFQFAYPGQYAFPNGVDIGNVVAGTTVCPVPSITGPGAQIEGDWPTNFEVKQYYNNAAQTDINWELAEYELFPGYVIEVALWTGDIPESFKKIQYQVGTAYLTQEPTNAAYKNPYYEPDATLWEPLYLQQAIIDGDPYPGLENGIDVPTGNGQSGTFWWTGSNGKRSSFASYYPASNNRIAAFSATAAHPGIAQWNTRITGYTDTPVPGRREQLENGTNPYGYLGYNYLEEGAYMVAHPDQYPENDPFLGADLPNRGFVSAFRLDHYNVVAQDGFYTNQVYTVRPDKRAPDENNSTSPGIPSTQTASFQSGGYFTVANYRGMDLPPAPSSATYPEDHPAAGDIVTWNWASIATLDNPRLWGNMMEMISWNDKLPLQAGEDYLKESKTYFENKKIQL